MRPEGRRHYPGVEILRGVAAMMVLVYHVIAHGQWASFPDHGPLLAFRLGWLGVDLFLVISGFVIALAVLSGVARYGEGAAFRRDFAGRRWRRIAPLYFLTLLAFLFLVQPQLLLMGWQTLALHLGSHALFLHNLLADTHGSINGPNWSVALEMQFYLLMLLAGPWLVRQRVAVVLLLMCGVAIAWRAATFAWMGGAGAEAWKLHIYTTQLPGSLDEFAFGIVLAILVTRPGWLQRALAPTPLRFLAACAVAAAAVGVAMWVFFPRGDYWPRWEMVVGWRTLLALAFGAVVAAAVALPEAWARWLWPLRYLGEISYGIYLWHLPVLLTLLAAGVAGGPGLLAATLAGTLALAAFSWHVVERPWLRRPT
ncbi:MAG TPA: hypothetical protein DC063_11195 [Arenimonas sp.]|nr:hypothetical protein [Arenimonas sp.]